MAIAVMACPNADAIYCGSFLFKITKAAITPGIHAKHDNIATIIIDPQPLSYTANGGKIMAKITLPKLMVFSFKDIKKKRDISRDVTSLVS